jgi:hypothetical protein
MSKCLHVGSIVVMATLPHLSPMESATIEVTLKDTPAATSVATAMVSSSLPKPISLDSWLQTKPSSPPEGATTNANNALSWNNQKKRSPPQDLSAVNGKRQLSVPELSRIIMDLWKKDGLQPWSDNNRLFPNVPGYRENENAKLLNTARAFEMVITGNEKQWLAAAFAKVPETGTYEPTKQFLALVDKRILVLALWKANTKKYMKSYSLSSWH